MDPARMFKESLTSRPELENSLGQSLHERRSGKSGHVSYTAEAEAERKPLRHRPMRVDGAARGCRRLRTVN
jgi:hypothetical protein